MSTILIPTDFSQAARNAARYAMEFFGQNETRYIIYHVHDFSSFQNEQLEECESRMEAEIAEISRGNNTAILTVESAIGSGNIVGSILEYAKDREVDYIFMGTQANQRPRWLGSNTTAVLLQAHCPVVAIPETAIYKFLDSVVLPLDPAQLPEVNRFQSIIGLLAERSPRYHVISVLPAEGQLPDNWTKTLSDLMGENSRFDVHSTRNSDIPEGILDFCERSKPDMVLLFPKKRGLFRQLLHRSVTKKIAMLSELPLFSATW